MGTTGIAGAGRVLSFLLGIGLLAGSCAQQLAYRMVRPQASVENHYVGPDLEFSFRFHSQHLSLFVTNNGDAEVQVDWDRATFVRADGRAVKLVSTGSPLIGTLPLGSVTRVDLTLAEWGYPKGGLWQRRTHLERRLVHPELLGECSPVVRIVIPVRRFAGAAEYEMMEFVFQVRAATGNETEGGGYAEPPIF